MYEGKIWILHSEGCIGKIILHSVGRVFAGIFILS